MNQSFSENIPDYFDELDEFVKSVRKLGMLVLSKPIKVI